MRCPRSPGLACVPPSRASPPAPRAPGSFPAVCGKEMKCFEKYWDNVGDSAPGATTRRRRSRAAWTADASQPRGEVSEPGAAGRAGRRAAFGRRTRHRHRVHSGVVRPPPEPPRPGLPVERPSATGLGLTPSGRASSSCDDARKGPAPSEAASRGSGAPGGGSGAASGPGHVGRAAEVVTHVHTRGRAVKGKVVVLLSQSAVLMNRITRI